MLALAPVERALLSRADAPSAPPIFIVGPPRSGTTLLYELLVNCLRFSYFSNIAHRLYLTPAAATRVFRGRIRRWSGRYENVYGHIPGWGSPNEGGWIWRRWLPEESALTADDAPGRDIDTMCRTVAAVAGALDAPFMSKNVMHSVHMSLLDCVFPGCLFLEMHRAPGDNARSILRARMDSYGVGGAKRWLSVRPPGWEEWTDAHPVDQAVWQVRAVHRQVEASTLQVGLRRRLQIEYEAVCDRPGEVVQRVTEFLGDHGVSLSSRREAPGAFSRPASKALPEEWEERLGKALCSSERR